MKNKKTKGARNHTRVIAGRIKGKLIECPPGEIRPMTSMVKEALFDIIGSCEGMTMLDLFCGSGNISIEAFSRGLGRADLVENDRGKKAVIIKNLANAGFGGAKLVMADALDYCRRCAQKYDFIMIDPPFMMSDKEELLRVIGERELLAPGGFAVMHLSKKEDLDEDIGELHNYDTRKYGINKLMFYERKKS